MLFYKK